MRPLAGNFGRVHNACTSSSIWEHQSSRRTFLHAAAAVVSLSSVDIPPVVLSKTFVLAHGSWHGGWCWTRVAQRLRAKGHFVYTPSFTGMGDRRHLLNKTITIETFVEDIVQVFQNEDLTNVVLVGHSFGGVPISGVADRIPDRISTLVYLDAVVVESGKNAFSAYPPEAVEARIKAAEKANNGLAVPVPQPLPASWGLGKQGDPDYEWVKRHLCPHPLRTYTDALLLRKPVGNGIPRTYVHSTRPSQQGLETTRRLVRSQSGWRWASLAAPHDAMIVDPDAVVGILLQL